MTLRVFSNGGGVQSIAALVLSAERRIDYPIHLFCNVGDDSEHPATLAYVRDVAIPYAAAHQIEFHELRRVKRDGTIETLHGRLTKPGSRSLPIPVRMAGNGAPGQRACTVDFKIRVLAKWQREHGATATAPAVCGIGISLDEMQRARSGSDFAYQTLDYPLLRLRLSRADCRAIIAAAGLPMPGKSSCYFCPFHNRAAWQAQRDTEPELFARSVALETLLNERRAMLGKDAIYFSRRLVPLMQATSADRQLSFLPEDDDDLGCVSGHCFT